jgi:hypothetical protein
MGFLNRWQLTLDNVLLATTGFLFRHHTMLFPVSFYSHSDAACGALTFFRRFILHASSWMSTFVAFDRFVSIHLPPHQLKFMRNRVHVSLVLAAMFCLVALIDLENGFFYLVHTTETTVYRNNLTSNSTTNRTTVKVACSASSAVTTGSEIVSILMRTFIPALVMIVLDAYMIIDLRSRRARVKSRRSNKEIQFTFTVILSNILFFVFNSPLSVSYLIGWTLRGGGGVSQTAGDVADVHAFAHGLTLNIALMYQSSEFFITVAINKLFRKELCKCGGMVRRACQCGKWRLYRSSVRV